MARRVPASDTTKTTLYLSLELLRKAKHRAVDEDTTLQGIVERALEAVSYTHLTLPTILLV